MIEKQEPSQSIIKAEINSTDSGTESNTYKQNGKFGVGHFSSGEIKDEAKIGGVINEAPSNKAQANPSIDNQINITIVSEQIKTTQQLNSDKTSINQSGYKTDKELVTFSVVGTVDQINAKKLKTLLRQLRNISGDISIDIDDIELGSIRLILKGSQEGLERIEALFKSGALTEIEGVPVEDVRFITTEAKKDGEDIQTSERKRLAFTIAGNLELADIAKLKAAITETSGNDVRDVARKCDFSCQNLRGYSFEGIDVSYADFSEAQLQEVNFTNATLTGANFNKADIQGTNFTNANLRGANFRGAKAGLRYRWAIALVISSWLILLIAGLSAGWASYSVGLLFNTSSVPIVIACIASLTMLVTFIFTTYYRGMDRRSLSGDEQYAWMRRIIIAFAAIGGTSFRNADLTDADFTCTTLKNTDFRGAILTRTRWYHAKMLHHARLGTTYLSDAKVRQLLITGEGQGKKFDGKDLRGVNLQGANLVDASFIGADLSEANLQGANLSRAKLVQTQLDKADLTNAILTGATIEDWNITSHTNLDRVSCEYVFMRVPTKEDPNPRRKPDSWDETFSDGDFAEFIKPIVNTLDLYHNQDADPRAIAISLKQLAENHPEAEIEIVAMERRGQGNFLLRAETAPEADHSALSAEYFENYNRLKALPKSQLISLPTQKADQLQNLEIAFKTITTGLTAVAETPQYNLQIARFGGGFAATTLRNQIGGTIHNYAPEQKQTLAEAAAEIQKLLAQLQAQGYSPQAAEQQVASDLAKRVQGNPEAKSRLAKWGQYLGDAAANGLIGQAVVTVLKLVAQSVGIQIP